MGDRNDCYWWDNCSRGQVEWLRYAMFYTHIPKASIPKAFELSCFEMLHRRRPCTLTLDLTTLKNSCTCRLRLACGGNLPPPSCCVVENQNGIRKFVLDPLKLWSISAILYIYTLLVLFAIISIP